MTARTPLPGTPAWLDLATADQPAALSFYAALFGWEHTEPDAAMGGYANFTQRGELVAGCLPAVPGQPTGWTLHLGVEDADKSVALLAERGGVVHAPVMDVGELGRLAVVADPGGSGFGLWQAGTHTGFARRDEHGTPSWFELHTTAYDAVLPFYADVFGWELETVSDVPGFRYTVASVQGQQVAGVMDNSGHDDVTPGWEVYLHCDDVAAVQEQAVALGATVRHPAEQTPFGVLGSVVDPTGALVKLRHA